MINQHEPFNLSSPHLVEPSDLQDSYKRGALIAKARANKSKNYGIMILITIITIVFMAGWWFEPSWNILYSQREGLCISYMEWKIKAMFETTNQIDIYN